MITGALILCSIQNQGREGKKRAKRDISSQKAELNCSRILDLGEESEEHRSNSSTV